MRHPVRFAVLIVLAAAWNGGAQASRFPTAHPSEDADMVVSPSGFVGVRGVEDHAERWNPARPGAERNVVPPGPTSGQPPAQPGPAQIGPAQLGPAQPATPR